MNSTAEIVRQRVCRTCNKVLHGRSDKKFCNDQCRNLFNNQLNSSSNNYMRHIDGHLRRNRRILQQVLGEKRFVIAMISSLHNKGFILPYCTHTHTSRNGNTYHFCYEYGYMQLPNGQLRIVCKPRINNREWSMVNGQ